MRGDAPFSTGYRARVEPVFASARANRPAGTLRVLGIDPGLTRCGFAVVDGRGPGGATAITMGVIRTPSTDDLPHRLASLRDELVTLIEDFAPDVVSVERVFFQTNVRTAMSVGQASGLALCEASAAGCEVVQYTPNEVKNTVVGYGSATKQQVQKMVQTRLKLSKPPTPADAADAAALALCHLAVAPMSRRIAAATGGRR